MVNIKEINGVTYYEYKGIEIDKLTWEEAPTPICCDKITNEDMCNIVINLYNWLCGLFGKEKIEKYVKGKEEWEDDYYEYEKINEEHWEEEENLFIEFGGEYYEDM